MLGFIKLLASTASIGKLAANTAATYIGDVVLQAGSALIGKVDINVNGPYIDTISSADTSSHALSSQAVKSPVMIRVAKTVTGTVSLFDGTRANGIALGPGDVFSAHCTNLNQISYQFSVNAATEKFSVSVAV